jgi:cytochrome P450
MNAADRRTIAASARALIGYIGELIAERRRGGGADDLLSALITAQDDGEDTITDEELLSLTIAVLIAGHQTTVSLISGGLLLLLTDSRLMGRLRADPECLPAAIEEFIRYRGPADLAMFRYTLEPVRIGGVDIPAGQPVLCLYRTANHDPRVFPDPHRVRFDRLDNPHLGFGHGLHYCLGAALARLEGEVAIGAVLDRYPELALAHPERPPRWLPGLARALPALPVILGPSRPGSSRGQPAGPGR